MKQIAVMTDIHGLKEPLEAILADIKKRGITEIYSLGDNIGVGPNPKEVLDMLEENNIKSVLGNAEEYVNLGIGPYKMLFCEGKKRSQQWTQEKLTKHQIEMLKTFPHSIDLTVGNKLIGLSHFINDVRFDYRVNSVNRYIENMELNGEGCQQFYYTNSAFQKLEILNVLKKYGINEETAGYYSAYQNPLFDGKSVSDYDLILQGHAHFRLYEKDGNREFYTIRAAGIGYGEEGINMASYVIINETSAGYSLEDVFVPFDREKMEYAIECSGTPDKVVRVFTRCRKK